MFHTTTRRRRKVRGWRFSPQEAAGLLIVLAGGWLLFDLDLGGRHTPIADVTMLDLLHALIAIGLIVGGVTVAAIAERRG
jgi:hypothetical protein